MISDVINQLNEDAKTRIYLYEPKTSVDPNLLHIKRNYLVCDLIPMMYQYRYFEKPFTADEYEDAFKHNHKTGSTSDKSKASNKIKYVLDYDTNRAYFNVEINGKYSETCCCEFETAETFFMMEAAWQSKTIDGLLYVYGYWNEEVQVYNPSEGKYVGKHYNGFTTEEVLEEIEQESNT